MLKRRVARLEAKIGPAADAPRIVLLCDHMDNPSAAWILGSGELIREAGETEKAFMARVRAC